jgi:predicted dehydrogenase
MPNHLRYPIAKAFFEAGIDAVCDKPLAFFLAEGEAPAPLVERGRPLFALTYNYASFRFVRQARNIVRFGRVHTGEGPCRRYSSVPHGLCGRKFVAASVEGFRHGGTWLTL